MQLKGESGQEQIVLSIPGSNPETIKLDLSQEVKELSLKVRGTGTFHLERINDDNTMGVSVENPDDFYLVFLGAFGADWACGTVDENARCRYLRRGDFSWKGLYEVTIRGEILLIVFRYTRVSYYFL